jgi:hypothetical protein
MARTEKIILRPQQLTRRALAFGSLGRVKLAPHELEQLLGNFQNETGPGCKYQESSNDDEDYFGRRRINRTQRINVIWSFIPTLPISILLSSPWHNLNYDKLEAKSGKEYEITPPAIAVV